MHCDPLTAGSRFRAVPACYQQPAAGDVRRLSLLQESFIGQRSQSSPPANTVQRRRLGSGPQGSLSSMLVKNPFELEVETSQCLRVASYV